MLGAHCLCVFSKRAVLRPAVRAQDARGYERVLRCRRERGAIPRRRHAVRAREAARERADAAKSDRKADRSHGTIGRPQQRCSPLEAARQQIRVRRLAEGTLELAAEVRTGEAGRPCEVVDAERLGVASVDEVSRAEEMALGRNDSHPRFLPRAAPHGALAPPCQGGRDTLGRGGGTSLLRMAVAA
jgi:hypothetical protein